MLLYRRVAQTQQGNFKHEKFKWDQPYFSYEYFSQEKCSYYNIKNFEKNAFSHQGRRSLRGRGEGNPPPPPVFCSFHPFHPVCDLQGRFRG